jgi:photosystem II stability/assembly factor-like uncharacterized protein
MVERMPIKKSARIGCACLISILCLEAPAQTWTLTSAPTTGVTSIASSADGAKLVAGIFGRIYTSTNSGITWTTNNVPFVGWPSITSSADGSKLAAVAANGGGIYISTNSGGAWIQTSAPTNDLRSIASSADGSLLIAATGNRPQTNGSIYISTDSGVSWTQTTAPTNYYWTSVAASADGQKLVAAAGYAFGGPGYQPLQNAIYTSTNSGATWTLTSAPSNYWVSVASSADGSRLIASAQLNYTYDNSNPFIVLSPDGIWTSTNSGATWISNNVPHVQNWSSVASSADGKGLIAATQSAIYTSTNSGAVWISNDAPVMTWYYVASSADGNKLVAGVVGGGIYASCSISSPQMNLTPSPTNVSLSWIIPSTNFVLQQSTDLTAWVDLTNPPTLNLTNLQNEVTLPLSASNSFFRLKTP